jgi:hypothetical protein
VERLNLLTADLVKQAAMDKEAGIREHAAILAERFPACRNDLIGLTGDADAIVAFQATLSLGDLSGEDVRNAFAEVISRQGASPWFRTAVLSAPAGSTPGLLETLHTKHRFFSDTISWMSDFVSNVAGIVRQRKDPAEVSALESFGQFMKASGNLVWKRALDKERSDSLATLKK